MESELRENYQTLLSCHQSLLLLDNAKVAQIFRPSQRLISVKLLSNIGPNVSVLRALEVPEAAISLWVSQPVEMCLETEKFKENVKKVINMGFRPSSATFMKALYVITRTDASKWAQKMEVYRKCGWTEDDFLFAFRKNPLFMELSEKIF